MTLRMYLRKLAMGLALSVLGAPSAQAGVTQTRGFGSAVEAVDRHASFDTLVNGSPLAGYTEDGLVVDLPGACFCSGYFYSSSMVPTKISAADGQKLVALEFAVDRSSEFANQTIVYWEAHAGGATVGSGIVILPNNSFIGFFDPAGFDELKASAHFYLADAQAIAAVGYANAGPNIRNGLEIDNLMAEVARDPDADGRVGRFDNCPDVANPDQADADFDGAGDACDGFPDGGSALDQCLDELETLLGDPRLTDTDADGVDDAADRCPDTAAASEVDASGCSVHQFCSAFDAGSSRGRRNCSRAIWRSDDPLQRWNGDCKVVRGVCVAR